MKHATSGRSTSEAQHHRAFVEFLRTSEGQLPELHFVKHTPNESNGGRKVTRSDRRTGKRIDIPLDVIQKAEMGVVAGVWDFEYLGPNHCPIGDHPARTFRGFVIEFKARDRGLSDAQKVWKQHYMKNGLYPIIFRHYVDAANFVITWVGGDPRNFLFT